MSPSVGSDSRTPRKPAVNHTEWLEEMTDEQYDKHERRHQVREDYREVADPDGWKGDCK